MSGDVQSPPATGWVGEFLSHLSDVRGFSEETAITYRKALLDFDRRMKSPDHTVTTAQDIDRYAGRLALDGLSDNSRRSRLSALRSYFEFLYTRGMIPSNPARDVHPPRLRVVERIPTFTTAEINRIVFNFVPTPPTRGPKEPDLLWNKRQELYTVSTARDSALLAVMYQIGARASDLHRLERRDFTTENRTPVLVLREGKRSKEPVTLRLDRRVASLLDTYLAALDLDRAGIRHRALFPPLSHRRGNGELGISRNEIAAILNRRTAAVGIEAKGRRLSPHAFRYSIATHLYERKIRPEEIQFLLRHNSVQTTWRYIRLGSSASIQRRTIHALFWNSGPPTSDP